MSGLVGTRLFAGTVLAAIGLHACGGRPNAVSSLAPVRACVDRSGHGVFSFVSPGFPIQEYPGAEDGFQASWPLMKASPAPVVIVLLSGSSADQRRLAQSMHRVTPLTLHSRGLSGGAYVSWFWAYDTSPLARRVVRRCLGELS